MRLRTVFCIVQFLLLLLNGEAWSQVSQPGDAVQDSSKNPASSSSTIGPDSSREATVQRLQAGSDLKANIDYKAAEYMILDMKTKKLKLVTNGQIDYEDMKLSADTVVMSWEDNVLTAKGKMDSTGQLSGRPSFEENGQTYRADSMRYNIKSQKGLVFGARTRQGEDYILADAVKKADDNSYYIKNGKFTTCDAEHPHYYIRSKRLKIIPQDKIVTGPLMLVIEDFPLPLILPFGFFPNQTGKKSGIVMPTYGDSDQRGFFLRGIGYFWAINDNFDLLVKGDVFSKGGWGLNASTNYKKRYKYNGNLGLEYGVQIFGEELDPNYRKESSFWVRWNHDQTITPQAKLKANVSAGSTNYLNNYSYNESDYLNNNFKSTVNFQQSFANSPWSLSVNGDHNQNTQSGQVTLVLPSLVVNRSRLFPFKGKNAVGNKWYHKIGMNYTMNLKNQISAPDSLFADILFKPQDEVEIVTISDADTSFNYIPGLDYFRNGAIHRIPISTQLNVAKYVNITPSVNYQEYWYIRTTQKEFTNNELEEENVYGFATARDFSANVSASTRLYGVFQSKNEERKTAIRHTLLPQIGYRYKPDFSDPMWGYFETVQSDTLGNTQTYSRFEDGLFGGPSQGENQNITFSLGNILELKYIPKEADTTSKDPYTRVNLIDNLNIATSYNLAADSLNLSNLTFTARTKVLNNKFSVQVNGAVDPYAVNSEGRKINTFRYTKNGRIGRLSTLGIAFNTSITSKRRTGAESNGPIRTRPTRISEQEWNEMEYIRGNYVDFNLPWRLNLAYTLRYSNSGLTRDTTMAVNFNGDFNLSSKWKLGFTSGYDFQAKDFSYTSVTVYRDLHCWEMSMTWIPFGDRRSYNLSLNVKSSTLKDLKLTKRRDWQDRF